MSANKQDYAAMASQLLPGQAVEVLNDRMREVGKLNTIIADWLQERRRLEEQYSTALRRLASKQLEDVDLGIFSVPWSAIASSAETLADSHAALASKIEVDVERPLRIYTSTSRELQGMTTIQGNLASLAKDVDRARARLDRLRDKGADANKMSEAEREFSNANAQWESQAPYVFEHLQTADESRLNHLRDVLTQFKTHEVDQVEKDRASAEHCLNILLQVETTDEIKTYVLKVLSNAPVAGSMRSSLSTAIRPSSSNNLTLIRSQPDQDSQRSNSMHDDKRKSRFGGLKRLGTVVGKRDSKKRESKVPTGLTATPESSEKSARPPFHPLSGRFHRSKGDSALEPTREEELDDLPAPRSASPSRIDNSTSNGLFVGSNANSGTLPVRSADTDIRQGHSNSQHLHNQNGQTAIDLPNPGRDTSAMEPSSVNTNLNDTASSPRGIESTSLAFEDSTSPGAELGAPAFNVSIRDAPVQEHNSRETEAALASVAGRLQAPPVASRSSTIRGRRAARNSMAASAYFAPDEVDINNPEPAVTPIPAPVRPAAEPAPLPAVNQPLTGTEPIVLESSSVLGYVSQAVATSNAGNDIVSPSPIVASDTQTPSFVPRPASRSALVPQHTGDNSSIHSGTSVASQIQKHGDLTEIGLNSSVLETINARLENGVVVSSSVIGEIALAYTPADFSSPFGTDTIRLSNFSQLDKVAPNPAFISQSQPGVEGEYLVKLAGISRPQVAFKYQARLSHTGAFAPLIITTASKIESNQTSVIVAYSLNPQFNLGQNTNVTLSNVMLGLTLEGAVATSCQSRPVGSFSRDKNLIFWQLGDLILGSGTAPEKLLARFATESQATVGSVEARWEIAGTQVSTVGSGLTVCLQSHGDHVDSTDPFADESNAGASSWKPSKGPRRITSGQYVAR